MTTKTTQNTPRDGSTSAVKNVAINPAQLWLDGLTAAGRKGMQSQLRRCADILRPSATPDSYPWHTLDYASVMRVRACLLDAEYAVATVNMALSALKSVGRGVHWTVAKSGRCWTQRLDMRYCAASVTAPFCCFCAALVYGPVSWLR
ncbi:hypothetical protein [Buttiauxella sp. A2-C1_F]|uniref:hypothetical protein n=1 Tax=Buttiauxella sp. A2-C1_F TaxID=2904526 RepID=UPI00351D6E63